MPGPSRYYAPYVVTIAAGATLTAEIDLGGSWNTVYLEIPTLTSNSQHHIQAAFANSAAGGTYRRVYHPPINSATSSSTPFAISSQSTNCLVPIPGGLRFVKIETTASVASSTDTVYRLFAGD